MPNTLDPSLHGLDALSIPQIFAGCISNTQPSSSSAFAEALVSDDLQISEEGGDSALQNLVGDDAERTARAWADSGRGAEKLAVMEQFLTGNARQAVRRVLGLAPLPRGGGIERAVSMLQRIRDKQRIQVCRNGGPSSVVESDQETESQDSDAHVRTAKMLFGIAGNSQIVESREEAPGTVPASRVPTPPVSESGSPLVRGSFRHVTHADLSESPPQGGRALTTTDKRGARAVHFADSEPGYSPPSCLIAHASSPPSLTSPTRSRSPAYNTLGRRDQNSFLTQAKRQHPLSQSLSHSQSRSPSPPVTVHSKSGMTKRRKLERLSTVPAHEENATASPWKQTVSAGAENITPAVTGKDVDAENRKAHRRVLRARSRVIEEKLRRALLTPTPSPQDKVP